MSLLNVKILLILMVSIDLLEFLKPYIGLPNWMHHWIQNVQINFKAPLLHSFSIKILIWNHSIVCNKAKNFHHLIDVVLKKTHIINGLKVVETLGTFVVVQKSTTLFFKKSLLVTNWFLSGVKILHFYFKIL